MGTIRIIAGRFRGRTLRVPDAPGLRPTGSRVREALFDILGQDLTGFRVLDLYAGTGALGLEAISRGASRVVFVESSPALAQGIRSSAESLGVAGAVRVVAGRVEDVLRARPLSGPFDVVLADPPYGEVEVQTLAGAVGTSGLLEPAGSLVVEVPRVPKDPDVEVGGLTVVRNSRYGGTSLLFFKYRNSVFSGEDS